MYKPFLFINNNKAMTHLDAEIKKLRSDIINMWGVVRNQLHKANQSLSDFDKSLALDVISQEKRVNAFELKINMECENLLALFHPVANDLRFILASLKIAYNLERIGDYAKSIAKLVDNSEEAFDEESLNEAHISQMFFVADGMLADALKAFEMEDSAPVSRVFANDRHLNDVNQQSNSIIGNIIHRNPSKIENALNLLSIIRKLERVGDQTKGISEEIIFYLEAKMVRHKKEIVG